LSSVRTAGVTANGTAAQSGSSRTTALSTSVIAMNDPLLVRGLERLRDLPGDRQRFVEWDRSTRDAIGKRGPLDQFEDERADIVGLFQTVNVFDVRVVE
jgi:hypothetical protein